MPITKVDGTAGLLASGSLAEATLRVPNYLEQVAMVDDSRVLLALFRDYTLWASAFCLEPCHQHYLGSGDYGRARDRLPPNISVPLLYLSSKLRAAPWCEYAQSYALANWRLIDATDTQLDTRVTADGFELSKLRLIRAFEGSRDEAGFVLVHVAMVSHTPKLVAAVNAAIDAAFHQDGHALRESFRRIDEAMRRINEEMEQMWTASSPPAYQQFRTFIMGVRSQPMFPDGLLYELPDDKGIAMAREWLQHLTDDGHEVQFEEAGVRLWPRGESGANDSIIPTLDNLCQLTARLPLNPLTEILRDFRRYRPAGHAAYIAQLEQSARDANVRLQALKACPSEYMRVLDHIRAFRTRHWNFVKRYILQYSHHPVATGGSPILTYLPNQLRVVLEMIIESHGLIDKRESSDEMRRMKESAVEQREALDAEVLALQRQQASTEAV